jgi:DNA-binding response OmpR family regulator
MDVFHNTNPGLVVLDVCLPRKSGQDLCRQIRGNSESVPLLVLSAVRDVADVVLLLELGADGYMTKPFSPWEFLARVRAFMRTRSLVKIQIGEGPEGKLVRTEESG